MLKIKPKEEKFFDLFEESAEITYKAAELFSDLINDLSDKENKVKAIKEMEHKGDQKQHEILKQLNLTFITPFEREDIYTIATKMDDIIDFIDATASRFVMFNVDEVNEFSKKMGDLILTSTKQLINLMKELRVMKKSKSLPEIIIEINKIEEDGDAVFRDAVTELFIKERPVLEVIKWREIYDHFENTLDSCEVVANIIEGVVMKNA